MSRRITIARYDQLLRQTAKQVALQNIENGWRPDGEIEVEKGKPKLKFHEYVAQVAAGQLTRNKKTHAQLTDWALNGTGGWRTRAEKQAGVTAEQKPVADVWVSEGLRRTHKVVTDAPNSPRVKAWVDKNGQVKQAEGEQTAPANNPQQAGAGNPQSANPAAAAAIEKIKSEFAKDQKLSVMTTMVNAKGEPVMKNGKPVVGGYYLIPSQKPEGGYEPTEVKAEDAKNFKPQVMQLVDDKNRSYGFSDPTGAIVIAQKFEDLKKILDEARGKPGPVSTPSPKENQTPSTQGNQTQSTAAPAKPMADVSKEIQAKLAEYNKDNPHAKDKLDPAQKALESKGDRSGVFHADASGNAIGKYYLQIKRNPQNGNFESIQPQPKSWIAGVNKDFVETADGSILEGGTYVKVAKNRAELEKILGDIARAKDAEAANKNPMTARNPEREKLVSKLNVAALSQLCSPTSLQKEAELKESCAVTLQPIQAAAKDAKSKEEIEEKMIAEANKVIPTSPLNEPITKIKTGALDNLDKVKSQYATAQAIYVWQVVFAQKMNPDGSLAVDAEGNPEADIKRDGEGKPVGTKIKIYQLDGKWTSQKLEGDEANINPIITQIVHYKLDANGNRMKDEKTNAEIKETEGYFDTATDLPLFDSDEELLAYFGIK